MLSLRVNGKMYSVDVEPETPLLWVIRDTIGLTGTKYGCGIAQCGACTVHVDGVATRSCSIPVSAVTSNQITTIEGLAKDGNFHPLQGAFHREHGLQCGFCTPGMLIVALDFLRINPSPTEEEVREAMSAVICRCTGYRNIVRAVVAAAEIMRAKR